MYIYLSVFKSGGANEIDAPDFVGKTYEEIIEITETKEYKKLELVSEDGGKIPENIEGIVIEQSPKAGKSIKNTSRIRLIFGEAPKEPVLVPDVEARTERDAIDVLEREGFKVKIDYEASDEIPQDRVVRTSPAANTMADFGSEVTIYLSSGEEDKYTRVPALYGKTEAEAESILKEVDLVLGSTKSVESNAEKGTIVGQSREEGDRVEKGFAIDVEISKGPKEPTINPSNPGGPVAPINPAA